MMKLVAKREGRVVSTFELIDGAELLVGSAADTNGYVAGEPYLSGRHTLVRVSGRSVHVHRCSESRNPVFFRGQPSDEFDLGPDDYFVIGSTTFQLVGGRDAEDVSAPIDASAAAPAYEFTLGVDDLRARGGHRDRMRLLDLMELPEVLRTKSRPEFYLYACGMLRMATGGQWVRVLTCEDGQHIIFAEDAVVDRAAPRPVSQQLVEAAIRSAPQPVTYCWTHPLDHSYGATAHEGVDWAICCAMSVPGEPAPLLYVAGTDEAVEQSIGVGTQSGARTFLRDMARLVGLVTDIIGRAISLQKVEAGQARLGRFFSGKLVSKILEAEGTDELSPKIAEATIMFFDIRGFSLLTEGNLERILEYEGDLRRVLTAMTQCVYDYDGVVLRYMGDGILACWNVPYPADDHVELACLAALDMVDGMAEVTDGWECGIGLGVGNVVAGSLGSDQIYAYDVLGAVANQTARVEGITKAVGVPILVTDEVCGRISSDKILVRRVARFRPAGMDQEVALHTIEKVPSDPQCRSTVEKRFSIHAEGLAAFESGDWERAFNVLHPIVQDDAAAFYVYKLALQGQPPRDWRGVVELAVK